MKMRKLKISLRGKGYCHWTESHGSGDNRRTESYTGREELIQGQELIVFGGAGSDATFHPAGSYTYAFNFFLPPALPSSFEAGHGYIRYFLTANIDKPWKFDHNCKLPIIINEVIDTNSPTFMHQPGGEISKEVGCCCCPSGILSIRASVDRQAYCPGEAILVTADVNNGSSRDMRKMMAKIIQRIEYHATTKTKVEEKTVVGIDGPPIPRTQFANWHNQPINVPAINPSIITCNVLQVHYFLVVEVDLPMGFDPKVKLPVILGTVPFRALYGLPPMTGAPAMLPNTFEMTPAAQPPPGVFGYPDMPPPSYSAAVGQKPVDIRDEDDNKYTMGNLNYTPIYTYAAPSAPPGQPPPTWGAPQ